jgi:8-oxo-dGTP diphosphatase
MEQIKLFGSKLENVEYVRRQGVYAIILNHQDGKVAVVKTSTGYFLPGGGVEENEEHEECLKRECLEEIGYETKVQEFVGRAERYFYSTTLNQYMVSDGLFYITDLVGLPQTPSEDDHELVWIKRSNVTTLLFHEHQAWAVEQAFSFFTKQPNV